MDQQDAQSSSDREVMDYVGQVSRELAIISERRGRFFLAYLLSLAAKVAMAVSGAEVHERYGAKARQIEKAGECP